MDAPSLEHTPGNWQIFREQGSRILIRAMPYNADLAPLGGPAICQVFAGPVGDHQAADNALLIAAAPDLLAALSTACDQLLALNRIYQFTEGDREVTETVLAKVQAALAKAIGED